MRTERKTCPDCKQPFESHIQSLTINGVDFTLGTSYCDDCQKAREASLDHFSRSGRIRTERPSWEEIAPRCYQGFDLRSLPNDTARTVAAKVFEWRRGPKGIGLFGPSRSGKTFILHELMRRWYEHGVDVEMMTSTSFALAMASPMDNERNIVLRRCCEAEILFLDDIGKEKQTTRVEADFFHVFEERRRHELPVFTSVNSDGSTLASAMSKDGGWPIINRLKYDLCEFIAINPEKAAA